MTGRSLLVLLHAATLAASLVAGCVGDGPGTLGDIRFDEATGAIRGTVLDETELPVAGATVTLSGVAAGGGGAALTDEAGVFRFGFVPPGRHVLNISAPGFDAVERDVTVTAGAVTDDVTVVLDSVASDRPYSLTFTHRRTISGFVFKATPECIYLREAPGGDAFQGTPLWNTMNTTKTCTGSTLICDGGDPCSQWNFNETLTENPGWRTIVFEGEWTPTSATTGRSFYIDLAAPGYRSGNYIFTDPEVWYDMDNQPPVFIRADNPDELLERGLPEEQWCCAWIARLFPAQCDLGNCFDRYGPDVGIMHEQSITLYQSFGFHAPLAPDFSARPIA